MNLAHKLRNFSSSSDLRQQRQRQELALDPWEAKRARVRDKLNRDVAYRTSVLRKVKTLQALGNDELRLACETMEEHTYSDGQHLMVQGEKGDCLYLLESGNVAVTRRNDPSDMDEPPMMLAKLPKDTCFGEIALLTEEPRSATITAIGSCKAVSMKKHHFDEILAVSNAKQKKIMAQMCNAVINSVPLFKDLKNKEKSGVIDLMTPVSYPTGSYICRQGGLGNSFFIIMDGNVRCTVVNPDDGEEREVVRLGPGSFFGEQALLDPSSIRSANIISTESTNCLSLSRENFTAILRDLKQAEIAANQEVYNRPGMNRNKKGKVRRISGMGQKSLARTEAMNLIVPRITKFIGEALWTSLYSKLFVDVTLFPKKMEEYGEVLWEVMHDAPHRDDAARLIRARVLNIARNHPDHRTIHETSFLCGVLRQNNKLRQTMCADWHPFQYTELCKGMVIKTFKPLDTIVDVGTHGTTMFLILRGAARRWKGTQRTNLIHDEDLIAGDIFGEMAMDGNHTRKICVRAMTECDVAIIEESVFFNAQNKGITKLSTHEKFLFLRGLQIFRHTDDTVVQQVAHAVSQVVFPRKTTLCIPGTAHQDLLFLNKGYAEVVVSLDPRANPKDVPNNCLPVVRVNQGEVFGESGFINNKNLTSPKCYEKHYIVATQRMDALALAPHFFHLIEKNVVASVMSSFKAKQVFRDRRLRALNNERIQVHVVKKSMKHIPNHPNAAPENENGKADTAAHAQGVTTARGHPESKESGNSNRRSMSPASNPYGSDAEFPNITSSASVATGFTGFTGTTSRPSTTGGSSGGAATAARHQKELDSALEDIPLAMNGHFDPFMVLDSCFDARDQAAKQFMLRQIKRPQIVRSRGRTTGSRSETGYAQAALEKAGGNNVRPGTGCVGTDVAMARFRAQQLLSRDGSRPSTATAATLSRPGTAGQSSGGWMDTDTHTVVSVSTGLPPVKRMNRPKSSNALSSGASLVSALTATQTNTSEKAAERVQNLPIRPNSSSGKYLRGSGILPLGASYSDVIHPEARTDSSPSARRSRSRSASPNGRQSSRPGTAPA